MRKLILTAALAALSFTVLPQAHAADTSGWYVNAGAGSAHYSASGYGYNGSDSSSGAAFNLGWRKGVFGIEGGYTDLGSVKYSDGYGDSAKISGHGITLGLNLHYNMNPHFYLSTRGGAFFWHAKANASIYDPYYNTTYSGSESTSSTGWYGGVGLGYDINKNWGIGANYDYYHMSKNSVTLKTDMYMATVEYRF